MAEEEEEEEEEGVLEFRITYDTKENAKKSSTGPLERALLLDQKKT